MPPARAYAIVVLGRGVDPDGALPVLAKQRVARAAELFAWGVAPRLIFSGRCSLMTDAEPGVQTTSSVTGSGLIAQAKTTGFFEGYEEVLTGITGGRLPFRAFALTDPGRIVIDVRR